MISTGNVTHTSVTMTSLGLGAGARDCRKSALEEGKRELLIAAVWNAVDSLETKIEPALPGRPT